MRRGIDFVDDDDGDGDDDDSVSSLPMCRTQFSHIFREFKRRRARLVLRDTNARLRARVFYK